MKTRILFLVSLTFMFTGNIVNGIAQEVQKHETHEIRHHRFAAGVGHAFVPAHEMKNRLIVPTWGFDYEYWFFENFAIGIHSDMELQSYLVSVNHEEHLERHFPWIVSLVGTYKFWQNATIYLGPGREFEENKHLNVIRAGLEYEFELPGHWDLSPGIFYDRKQSVYDAWGLAILVGHKF